MAHIKRFDHIGIIVADLDSATAFFFGLGLKVEGTGSVNGEFVETVCGIPGAHCEITMFARLAGAPGGSSTSHPRPRARIANIHGQRGWVAQRVVRGR